MDIKEFCFAWSKHHKVKLYLRDRSLTPEEVFAETGLLPSIAKRADQLSALTLGYGIGATFDDEEQSTLGVKVSFDDLTPSLVRLLCMMDVLDELRKSATNEAGHLVLDELLYD